jgi:hypothetical protein
MDSAPTNTRGAVPLGGERRRRPAWLAWLLGLLALAALVVLLITLLGGDDEDKGSASSSASRAQTQQAGTLTSGGQALLPLPDDGLSALVGQDTVGTGLTVQAIVEGQGFWVGTSQSDRLYVEYGGEVGKTESGFKPSAVGERVDLDGPVHAAPANPEETLKLSADDAAQVREQGAYINANKVSPAAAK